MVKVQCSQSQVANTKNSRRQQPASVQVQLVSATARLGTPISVSATVKLIVLCIIKPRHGICLNGHNMHCQTNRLCQAQSPRGASNGPPKQLRSHQFRLPLATHGSNSVLTYAKQLLIVDSRLSSKANQAEILRLDWPLAAPHANGLDCKTGTWTAGLAVLAFEPHHNHAPSQT